jgi:hypothetical protein
MSLGKHSPIGRDNLAAFAIATAFRSPEVPTSNARKTKCFGCGVELRSGSGLLYRIVGQRTGQLNARYLCPACSAVVDAAIRQDGRFRE